MEEALKRTFDLAFPVVKNPGRLLTDELSSLPVMTEKDIAGDREIREYPTRYDHFRSRELLVEYLRYQLLTKHKKWNPGWLGATRVVTLPINIVPGVYYRTSSPKHIIYCVEPAKNIQDDMREGGTLVELDPEQWELEVLEEVVAEVKNLLIPA